MTLYPDADIGNADWPKTTWDLALTVAEVDLLDADALETLIALPAFNAAPPDVRAAVLGRLEAISDDLD